MRRECVRSRSQTSGQREHLDLSLTVGRIGRGVKTSQGAGFRTRGHVAYRSHPNHDQLETVERSAASQLQLPQTLGGSSDCGLRSWFLAQFIGKVRFKTLHFNKRPILSGQCGHVPSHLTFPDAVGQGVRGSPRAFCAGRRYVGLFSPALWPAVVSSSAGARTCHDQITYRHVEPLLRTLVMSTAHSWRSGLDGGSSISESWVLPWKTRETTLLYRPFFAGVNVFVLCCRHRASRLE